MTWNFNINDAPKDHAIIAASECGIVTKSYWIEKEQRWNMFTRANRPVAWQIWPDHPKPPQNKPENLESMFE